MKDYEEKYGKYLGNIERKEKSSFKRLILLSFIPISLAVIFLFYSIHTVKEKNNTINMKNDEILSKDSIYGELSQDVLKTLNELSDSTKIKLDSAMREKIRLTKDKIRKLPRIIFDGNQTIVRYYQRNSDDPMVKKVIEELGFYLNIRPVEGDTLKNKVNVIYFGDSVKLSEVKLLAKELIKTKNTFHDLVNYQLSKHYKWKNRAIEIGYDERYNVEEILTEESIESKLQELTVAKKW